MLSKRVFLDGAVVIINNFSIAAPLLFDVKQDSPFIKLHFGFKGKMDYEPNNSSDITINIGEGQYNLFYLPLVDGVLNWHLGQKESVEIECSEDFIRRIFENNFLKISGAFGRAMREKKPYKMWENAQDIPEALEIVLDDIIKNSQKKETDIAYWELQIVKIFLYMFSLINSREEKAPLYLSGIEKIQITKIEKILRKNIQSTITIEELALSAGINRYKLNRNFKKFMASQYFITSPVFGWKKQK